MKIWIEMPKMESFEQAEKYAAATNKMLRKLGVEYDAFWATDEQRYTRSFINKNEGDVGSGFTECENAKDGGPGAWFNLDYLSK